MKVTLLHNTPLWVNAHGARTCWASGDKSDTEIGLVCQQCGTQSNLEWSEEDGEFFDTNFILDVGDKHLNVCRVCKSNDVASIKVCGPKDKDLIDRVGNKFRHASILEHVSYNFYIEGISRAVLQEFARHRIASLSVKSTRYTLKELKEEHPFVETFGNNVPDTIVYDRAANYLVMTGVNLVDRMSVLALENLRKCLASGISNDRAKYCMPESYKTELTWSINMRSMQNFLYLRSDKTALWEIRLLAGMVYDSLPEEHKYLFENSLRFPDETENAE